MWLMDTGGKLGIIFFTKSNLTTLNISIKASSGNDYDTSPYSPDNALIKLLIEDIYIVICETLPSVPTQSVSCTLL